MLLVHLRRLLMRVAVTLCRQTQEKCRNDKNYNAFLFWGENEFVFQLLPVPTIGKFQRASCFTRGRTRTDG